MPDGGPIMAIGPGGGGTHPWLFELGEFAQRPFWLPGWILLDGDLQASKGPRSGAEACA